MGYWVKDIKINDKDIENKGQVYYFCCTHQHNCDDCPYVYSQDCENDCLVDCDNWRDIFKKFGYRHVEDNESQPQPQSKPESNPDWPPICNYIGIPPETNFMFDDYIYCINMNGYVYSDGIITTTLKLYGILNHPDKIKILAPLSEDDKTMVKQLYNAFGNVEIRKVADPNGNFSIWLTLGDGTSVQISNEYFKNLLSGRDYYLADLNKQIDQ